MCSSMQLCSYNFVLNEPPNNNDVMRIANIVLNEVTNSNDAMSATNNVCLTTKHTTILNGGYIAIMRKSRLTRDNRY